MVLALALQAQPDWQGMEFDNAMGAAVKKCSIDEHADETAYLANLAACDTAVSDVDAALARYDPTSDIDARMKTNRANWFAMFVMVRKAINIRRHDGKRSRDYCLTIYNAAQRAMLIPEEVHEFVGWESQGPVLPKLGTEFKACRDNPPE